MTEWTIEPVGGAWFASALALLLILALMVGPAGKRLSRRRRLVLRALRIGTALLLLFCLLRPTLVATDTRKLPGSLVVMTDTSRSMQVTDSLGNESRWQTVRSIVSGASEVLSELSDSWDLKFYEFNESSQPLKLNNGLPELPEVADGPQTAIGSALEDVLDREAQQRVVAVLLLSDGAQRAFAPRDVPPQTVVRRLAVDEIPLYTFTFGKPSLGLQSDLRVDDLLVSDTVFAETPVTVTATVGANGYANQTFKAQLLWETVEGNMEVVDTREVLIERNKPRTPISLTHTPRVPGEYKVSVQIVDQTGDWPAGELVTSNNAESTFVSVLKGGVNVLYLVGATRIGGGPSVEPRFVRAALAAHADIEVRYDLLNYRKKRLDIRSALEEGEFDVFMLGDVDVTALNNASWEKIADAVEAGAGLAMLGGFHSFGPGGFRGSALEPLLPVRLGRAERQNFGEPPRQDMHVAGPLQMLPAQLGNTIHPIMRLGGDSPTAEDWSELPPLDGANRFERTSVKPSAQVIAEMAGAGQRPLLVTSAWASGRTLAFAGDSTWRWQMEGHVEEHQRFWRQLIMWLASKDDTDGQSVWVRLDGRRYQRGGRVTFELGALDAERNPLATADFDIQVEGPDGETYPLRASRRGEQRIASFNETSTPGDYRITVTATDAGQILGTTEARFNVPDRDMELDQPAAEPTLLAALANITADAGGQGLAPEEFSDLLEQLKARTTEFEEEIRQQQTLWDTWPIFLGLVGMLGCEWFLRKRWGLV
ncbi:MAG: glutamine amidotransferase [Planctomycetota bacterium]